MNPKPIKMDSYEATRVVFSRIQNLDPENASKIMGLLLIQDYGQKEMIQLAFGPESLVHSVILKARKELGFTSNTPSTPSTPSSPSPFSRQNSSLSASSRFFDGTSNHPSPLNIPNPLSSWANFSNCSDFQNTEDLISPSAYSSNNTAPFARSAPSSNGMSNLRFGSSSSSMNSLASPFYCNSVVAGENDLIDEFHIHEQLSFLDDESSPPLVPESPDFFYPGQPDLASSPYLGRSSPHRRTCSMNDICLGGGADDVGGGFGWKPCLYFSRGYCKNDTSCRFVHGDDGEAMVGSLDMNKLEMMKQCQELLRSKSAHQQRAAAASQLMGSSNFPYSPKNCMNFLLQQQKNDSPRAAAAAALVMGEEMNKFSRNRLERNEFLMNDGMEMVNPASRQIYLTFPADSTFKEEDVSNYFSMFGPVQDVRIPYQQKRMFGFVTFVYPDTVKLIHAKGNPHFVCDARVLVKPYKEKGKVPDKFRKQQQQMETGEYSSCSSPTSFDSRDPFDLQLGPRMLYNTQDLLWRRKLEEQADLQQAIELQNRRLMGLQLLDVKRSYHQRALSTGAAIPSPIHSPSFLGHSSFFYSHSDRSSPEEDDFMSRLGTPVIVSVDDHLTVSGYEKEREKEKEKEKEKESPDCLSDENGNGKSSPHHEENDFSESLEHSLPDSLFASPKAARVYRTAFSTDAADDADKNTQSLVSLGTNNLITSPFLPATSTLDMASLKSCYFQVPRFASGHGTTGI